MSLSYSSKRLACRDTLACFELFSCRVQFGFQLITFGKQLQSLAKRIGFISILSSSKSSLQVGCVIRRDFTAHDMLQG